MIHDDDWNLYVEKMFQFLSYRFFIFQKNTQWFPETLNLQRQRCQSQRIILALRSLYTFAIQEANSVDL